MKREKKKTENGRSIDNFDLRLDELPALDLDGLPEMDFSEIDRVIAKIVEEATEYD